MLESQIQIHPTIGPQNWKTYGTNTDLLKPEVGSTRGAIHLARITRCLHTWHQETNSDITEWAECRNLLAQWQRSGSIRDTIQARTLVLPGACVREDVVERTSQRTARTMGQCSKWLTYSSVTLPTRNFQRQSHYRRDNWGTEEAVTISRVHSTTRRFSSRPYWQPISCVFTIEYASCMRLKNHVFTMRTAGDEEPIDLDREQLSLITQKQRNNATSSRRFAAATHRKSRDADSESFRTGSMWQNGGKWTTLHYHWIRHGWKQLYSFYAENTQVSKDFSKVKITSNSWQSRQERASDRNRSIRICWNFGHRSASTVTTTRKFEVLGAYFTRTWTARTTINLFYRNWTPKILEPCFRRSRRVEGEHRRKVNTRFGQEAARKPKLILIGFSQRDWKITWARAQHKRNCEFVNISKHFTKILRHGGCHGADGAVRWTLVLTLMEDAEQTPNWNKKDWIDALSRSTDKSKYGVWWGPKQNEYLYACSTLLLSRG